MELQRQARLTPGLAGQVGGPLDLAAVLARRDEIIHHLDDGSQVRWARSVGIDVVRGRGRLAGVRTVEVTGPDGRTRTLHARLAVVLATGTTATIPPTEGLRAANPWTSRDVTNLHEVPERIAVIGGGVVACESSTWLGGLGAQVTILQRSDGLLAGNEPFAGRMVAENFAAHGVTVRLGVNVQRVHRPEVRDSGYGHVHGGEVEIVVDGEPLLVDEVVAATGRTPATADLGLDTVGIDLRAARRPGFVDVDDHLTVLGVEGSWLYAVGDVNGRVLLTHQGKYQGRICGAVIAARAEGRPTDGPGFVASADHGQVPQVTFTDPQVASVGVSEAQARAAGTDVATVEYDLADVSGAAVQQTDYQGRAKLVIDRSADVIVGATFVGPEIAELLHSATIAVVGRVPLSVLWHAVPSYPTVSEVWLRLLETYRRA